MRVLGIVLLLCPVFTGGERAEAHECDKHIVSAASSPLDHEMAYRQELIGLIFEHYGKDHEKTQKYVAAFDNVLGRLAGEPNGSDDLDGYFPEAAGDTATALRWKFLREKFGYRFAVLDANRREAYIREKTYNPYSHALTDPRERKIFINPYAPAQLNIMMVHEICDSEFVHRTRIYDKDGKTMGYTPEWLAVIQKIADKRPNVLRKLKTGDELNRQSQIFVREARSRLEQLRVYKALKAKDSDALDVATEAWASLNVPQLKRAITKQVIDVYGVDGELADALWDTVLHFKFD